MEHVGHAVATLLVEFATDDGFDNISVVSRNLWFYEVETEDGKVVAFSDETDGTQSFWSGTGQTVLSALERFVEEADYPLWLRKIEFLPLGFGCAIARVRIDGKHPTITAIRG